MSAAVTAKRPIFVAISDVHYDLSTMDLADKAMRQAIDVANEYGVPLVVAGDFTTHKAHMRSEVVRRTISTIQLCDIVPIFIVGNHDKDNERSEGHALEYLKPYATIIDKPTKNHLPYWTLIPYQSDVEALRAYLKTLKPGSKIIMHQGVNGTDSGEYMQDRTALEKEDLAGFTVISGHYHKGQHFGLPDGGSFTYIGNPYTLNFGEANDSLKGFLVVYSDGTFEHHSTHLRKHMKVTATINNNGDLNLDEMWKKVKKTDLLWLVVCGKRDQLNKVTKADFKDWAPENFRLEFLPTDIVAEVSAEVQQKSPREIFERMIATATGLTDEQRARLQSLWKDLI